MTVLRRIIQIAAIALNVFWLARSVWSVWGLVNWEHLLDNPFGYGHGWIVWASFLTPLVAIVALVWSFGVTTTHEGQGLSDSCSSTQ